MRILILIWGFMPILLFGGPPAGKKNTFISGKASYYASYFNGRLTASGERFNNKAMTCAHKSLPFGTYLKVTRKGTQKSVIVRVNDRGPFVKDRIIDLSQKAAGELSMFRVGVCEVDIEILGKQPFKKAEAIVVKEIRPLTPLKRKPAKLF